MPEFLVKRSGVETNIDVQHHKDEVQAAQTEILQGLETVKVQTKINTERYGIIAISSEIDRTLIDKNHGLEIGCGLLSRSIFGSLGYRYKRISVSALIGYQITPVPKLELGVFCTYRMFSW